MKKTKSFTMAEILLSLAVIGIIAAMTLPTLTANFQDRAFNAKRQALHARLSNALRTLEFEDYFPLNKMHQDNDTGEEVWDNFNKLTNDLTKVLSIKLINKDEPEIIFGNKDQCNTNNWYFPLGQCSRYPFAGQPNAYFQTVNGESIGLLLNPVGDRGDNNNGDIVYSMCFVLVYDLNGTKGPNKWGKDMGVMGAFYYNNIELYAPMIGAITNNPVNPDYSEGDSSTQKYKYPDLRLPTKEELLTLYALESSSYIPNIEYTTPLCAIDGQMRSFNDLLGSAGSPSNEEESSSCTYILITNDGSSPKNGVIIDFNDEDYSNSSNNNAQ